VNLVNLSKLRLGKPFRHANKSWPQATMDKGDSAIDEAAHENILTTADCPGEFEDFVAARMRPPASANWPTRDCYGQGGHRASGRAAGELPTDPRSSIEPMRPPAPRSGQLRPNGYLLRFAHSIL